LKIWSNVAVLAVFRLVGRQYTTIKAKFGKEEYTVVTFWHATFGPDWRRGLVQATQYFKIGSKSWFFSLRETVYANQGEFCCERET